jgi:UPF0042 nucleotide-binding protein
MHSIKIISFGFKYGRPLCNHFFDVGYLKNPWRAGAEDSVKYILEQEEARVAIRAISDYILATYKYDVAIYGIGCSGGRHRSPVISEQVAERLRKNKISVEIEHRDKFR